jgi:hypothetical protein
MILGQGMAQKFSDFLNGEKDSNYIESYYNDLAVRFFSGEKTNNLQVIDPNNPVNLNYKPNRFFNLGIGLNYRFFGINLATKIPYINKQESKDGKTSKFHLQSYFFTGKFAFDVITSFSQGYYLSNTDEILPGFPEGINYQRPDIYSGHIGLNVNYVFNHKKYSYRAAFNDTERQKKSAGSMIAGFEVNSYVTRGDSAFIPSKTDESWYPDSREINEFGVLAINTNTGYSWSQVFLKNGIATASYIVGLGIQENKYSSESETINNHWRLSFSHRLKLGLGYRYKKYYARVNYYRMKQYSKLKYNDMTLGLGTKFLELSVGTRFEFKKKSKS